MSVPAAIWWAPEQLGSNSKPLRHKYSIQKPWTSRQARRTTRTKPTMQVFTICTQSQYMIDQTTMTRAIRQTLLATPSHRPPLCSEVTSPHNDRFAPPLPSPDLHQTER